MSSSVLVSDWSYLSSVAAGISIAAFVLCRVRLRN